MPEPRCYIGTSGWSYPHWGKGRFYPKGLASGEWLEFYARHFSTVEVNSSFYRLPRAELVERWTHVTGSRFRFAVKLWRRITHDKRLADCGQELEAFLASLQALKRRVSALLVQLPPSFRREDDRLDAFLSALHKAIGRSRWRTAVEFRHPDWLCPPIQDLLNRHRTALCLADWPRCPVTEPNDAGFVYLRRHGPGGRYGGCYSAAQIAADAGRVCDWLADGREVFVYYNNDIDGHAVDNARQLMNAVGRSAAGERSLEADQ